MTSGKKMGAQCRLVRAGEARDVAGGGAVDEGGAGGASPC